MRSCFLPDQVRYTIISLIEGIGASQLGFGVVVARPAEIFWVEGEPWR